MMETSASTMALLRLRATRGVGAARMRKVVEAARAAAASVAEIIAQPARLRGVLDERQLGELAAGEAQVARELDELRAAGVQVLGWFDDAYPDPLRHRMGPPVLMVRGARALLGRPAVGFCGSRKASDKGLAVARDCADQLARADVVVVSGYAAGVDLAAHRAALEAGGTTTIVLAEGISCFRVKRELADVWDWERVCVVSELPARARWSAGQAMQRNATICGLSDAMVLIEARSTGGSVAAGRESLAMGVPLFVAEYESMPEHADGNRALLAQGAMALRRSRKTGRAALERVLAAMGRAGEAGTAAPDGETAPAQATLFET